MIKPVGRMLQGVYAGCGLDVGTDGRDSTKRGEGGSMLASQFEGKIASHGIPDEPHRGAAILLGNFLNNPGVILTEPIVIEGRCQMFGSATIALIDANAIPSCIPTFPGQSPHIVGFGAPFEAMNHQDGGVL